MTLINISCEKKNCRVERVPHLQPSSPRTRNPQHDSNPSSLFFPKMKNRPLMFVECLLTDGSHDNQLLLEEQEALDLFEYERIEKQNMIEHEMWVNSEKIANAKWLRLQEETKTFLQKRREQEEKIKLEWEFEKERKRKEEERLKQIEENNKKKQENFMRTLEQFLSGDSNEPPPELTVLRHTKPHAEPCPFFSKTACCRFGDQCSRNHTYPGISKVLLAINFYSHFGLDNATYNEYDTDVMLEYEDSDTYKEFTEFFYDVVPEFEKYGRIVQFKVCNNHERHLRGNTYVEYSEMRCAVAAYRALHSRWYGGKQLTLQFCTISSWKNAICGLQSRKRCPKGRSCNFLHIFKNPSGLHSSVHSTPENIIRSRKTPRSINRSWRWSESPEVEVPSRQKDQGTRERSRSRDRNHHREDRREESKYAKSLKRLKTKRITSSERSSRKSRYVSDSD